MNERDYLNGQMKNKKTMLSIIGVAILVIGLVGITYAFFNYTRIGSSNIIKTGRIYFSSDQDTSINLVNLFPIDVTNGIPDDNTKVGTVTINVKGDTTYGDGIEYLVSAVNVTNSINEKYLPLSISVSVENNTENDPSTSLGTLDNDYYINRGSTVETSIYKILANDVINENDKLIVGYIKSGQDGVDGNIVIKAYIDKSKIAISDTYTEGDRYEVNTLNNNELNDCISYMTNLGYDGYLGTGETINNFCNGTGTIGGLTFQQTLDNGAFNGESLTYLKNHNIIRYLGQDGTTDEWVDDRIVLTTGEWNNLNNSGVSFQVKVEANEGIWVEGPQTAYTQIIKNVITPTNPINFAINSSSSNGEGLYILPGTENDTNPIYYYRGDINNNNVIFGGYCWQMVRTTDTGGIKMIYNGVVTGNGETCENTLHADRIISSSKFNSTYKSISSAGYMNNAIYEYDFGAPTSGAYFGNGVEYGDFDSNGTSEYRLIDDGNGSVGTTKDATHHYTCNLTSLDGTCTTLRYYYYSVNYNNYYINLTNGDLIEDVLYKMTGNGTNIVKSRNNNYELNQNDSAIKTVIESWFKTNLTNEVDSTKRNYQVYLEDTIYCNDRSFKTVAGGRETYQESGWNPNGGSLSLDLYFGTNNRVENNWYSTSNVPTTACPNETDRFSVSSGVAHLNYPVGLLTADEIIMAGASENSNSSNQTNYLYTGDYYWSMTPYAFYNECVVGFTVSSYGTLFGGIVYMYYSPNTYGVRPVVSLKSGVEFVTGGDGTPINPYVVKYN